MREVAKYLAGLVTGDLLFGIWLITAGKLPIDFLGIHLTTQSASWWLILDVVVIACLIYYAWIRKTKKRK